MPKKAKTEQTNGAHAPEGEKAPAAPAKRARPAAKKTGAKKATARKPTARKSAPKSTAYEPTDAEIQLRAYFIAERRAELSLEGDPARDWLDARQQLIDEAAKNRIDS